MILRIVTGSWQGTPLVYHDQLVGQRQLAAPQVGILLGLLTGFPAVPLRLKRGAKVTTWANPACHCGRHRPIWSRGWLGWPQPSCAAAALATSAAIAVSGGSSAARAGDKANTLAILAFDQPALASSTASSR
ncbi:MAG: hypothetical protein H7323_03310 [Frankiales bacterium]|nr:hypothetical protein [Frankiales bacterium]